MSLGGVSARFFVGVGAWLLGAAAATGGSLFAVSLLGQSLAPAPSQQLTVTAVNRALASEAGERPQSSPSASPSPTPSRRHVRAGRSAPPAAAPAPQATATPAATSTVLTSVGGTVVARCEAGGAYLVSWSPQQGYEVLSVVRGPATTALAKFTSDQRNVAMKVSCGTGAPTVTTSIHRPGDDGTGHDT